MVTQDQREIIAFLSRPTTHGPECVRVDTIETHSAIVFLAGARALKLKRAVRYDYLDFSTVERRRECCAAEVAVNHRTAPGLYRGVAVVTRDPLGGLTLDGTGTPVEWLVDMTRFEADALADRLAERHALGVPTMLALGLAVARMHATAPPCRSTRGGAAAIRWVIDGNATSLAGFGEAVFPAATHGALTARSLAALGRAAPLLDARAGQGRVRRCHGDLHLRNIVMLDGRPTPFDAVEFNDDIACIDVWYDVAFLLMDLWRRGLPRHANVVMNEYVRDTGDVEGLALLPLFLGLRAAVRAKTSATAATLTDQVEARTALVTAAQGYLDLALTLLQPRSPALVAIGGYSGSGKSTQAATVAPGLGAVPGALHLRSDVIRKDLFGLSALQPLPASAYTPEVTARVYARMRELAAAALAAHCSVVCDGVFADAGERAALAAIGRSAGVPAAAVWLQAPGATLLSRVTARRHDASDATTDVVRQQLEQVAPPGDWVRVDAMGPVEATYALVRTAIVAKGITVT